MYYESETYLPLMFFTEFYIVISYKMISLCAGAFRSSAIRKKLPGYHAIAYMDAAIVHDTGLYNIVATCLQSLCYTPTQEIIS